VPDLAGKIVGRRMLMQRARDVRNAIRNFEPRMDPDRLTVEPLEQQDRLNAVTFEIRGDITAAAQAMPVKFHTHVDAESASVDVEE
jgi:type VI secretion system protein ImpF